MKKRFFVVSFEAINHFFSLSSEAKVPNKHFTFLLSESGKHRKEVHLPKRKKENDQITKSAREIN